MNLLILAANGQIARLVEERILSEDNFKSVNLTLFLRNADRLANLATNPRVTLIEGDLNKEADVVNAAQGQDLIFSAVVDHDDTGSNRPTKNIIKAAQENQVHRIIETSLLGLYNEVPGEFGRWNNETCFGGDPSGSAPVLADQLLKDSGLNYTTLRLPWLNDRDEIKYTITHRNEPYVGVSGSRKSIADVVLKIVADPNFAAFDSMGIADPDTQGLDRPVY
ncbi:NAD(P)H-binding protein [Limosilactobacillus gastricus]|uniref:NAD(P)H-binding protein n=1 Tax=Limosilactobacillus gastricus TaxID=227942 RepID=UPI0026EECA5B|nr:NAD(P)H-binding protein [Limosilactobacillus gastricus]